VRYRLRHEQRVTDKGCVSDDMRRAGWCVAGCVHDECRHASDGVGVTILEKAIKLAAVALEFRALVEDFAEGLLHGDDMLADPELSAHLLLNVGRRRQMIGVRVSLDQPFDLEPVEPDVVDDGVRRLIADAACRVIDIHDGIDHRAGRGLRILHQAEGSFRRPVIIVGHAVVAGEGLEPPTPGL
jgi:hypothetical protein